MQPAGAAAVSWWLMDCALPDLNWARLRILADGAAEVFDCDGKTHRFPSADEARHWLAEDEFVEFATLDDEDMAEYGLERCEIAPPAGGTDPELLPQMLVTATDRR